MSETLLPDLELIQEFRYREEFNDIVAMEADDWEIVVGPDCGPTGFKFDCRPEILKFFVESANKALKAIRGEE